MSNSDDPIPGQATCKTYRVNELGCRGGASDIDELTTQAGFFVCAQIALWGWTWGKTGCLKRSDQKQTCTLT